jgi:hypothetical protein
MTSKLVYITANAGQLVYDAIDEAISDGKLPIGARLGPRDYCNDKPMFVKDDEEILGSVNVRPRESFYIVHTKPTE